MATRPTEIFQTITKPNGGLKTVKLYSYVITLCRKGTDEVKAVRVDGYSSKYDAMFKSDIEGNYPKSKWTLKSILRLYDSDFEEGT